MYVSEENYEDYELILSSSRPIEILVYEANEKDVMVPSFVRVTQSTPTPGRKISVEVADNGYVVKMGAKIKIATGDWGNRLEDAMEKFLNEDVETERPLTEHELEDADLVTYNLKMNTAYAAKKKRAE